MGLSRHPPQLETSWSGEGTGWCRISPWAALLSGVLGSHPAVPPCDCRPVLPLPGLSVVESTPRWKSDVSPCSAASRAVTHSSLVFLCLIHTRPPSHGHMHTAAPSQAPPTPQGLRDSNRCLLPSTTDPACQGPRNSCQLRLKLPTQGPSTQLHLPGLHVGPQAPARASCAPGCLQGTCDSPLPPCLPCLEASGSQPAWQTRMDSETRLG